MEALLKLADVKKWFVVLFVLLLTSNQTLTVPLTDFQFGVLGFLIAVYIIGEAIRESSKFKNGGNK